MTSATADTKTSTTRGRPRSSDRTEAILLATQQLCREVGYDSLRMQDVADRAGAGLATIYRRWSTKPELVADAMRHGKLVEFELTGDAPTDLRALVKSMAGDFGTGDMITGFLSAIREHEALRMAAVESIMGDVRPSLVALMNEIAPDAPSIEFLADAIAGALIVRTTLLDDIPDPTDYADSVVELVLALR